MESEQTAKPLARRIVLVTGAAEGLGRAIALAAGAQGATLILSDHPDTDLDSVYDAIEAAGGPQPAILPINPDTADAETYGKSADMIGETFHRLDGLIHCTAYAPYLARVDDYEPVEWERVLRISLTGPFLLTQACMPLLRASSDAAVAFTSDRVGRTGKAYWGAFAAAKFGIEGLAQVLADETEGVSPIRVACFDPGILRTGLRSRLYPGEDPWSLPDPQTATAPYLEHLTPRSANS
jgi:NAD(P)-dependent dehydrogenase (short-subunit alcohol dehydrogenase family)